MKTVDSINFAGKRAVVRVDFNVPLDAAMKVTDNTRIAAAIPTIKKIIKDGGSAVLMSHLGRPKGGYEEKFSLMHVQTELSRLLNQVVKFCTDCRSDEANKMSSGLKAGEILLLENLRFYKEEEKGDEAFARVLAGYGDVYVNDAFGTAHRAHASTAVIAKFFGEHSKCFGYLMAREVESLNKVLHSAERPFTAVLGGAKVSDKILIIEKLMEKADNIIIGGGMAFTFVKAMGGEIGKSLCEEDKLDIARDLLDSSKKKGVKLCIPTDAIAADKFADDATTIACEIGRIPAEWMGLDIGEKSINEFAGVISKSKTILWNGPMGVFEMSKFENGTKQVAKAIEAATKSGSYSLVGGGDSVAAVGKYDMKNSVSYVSTGGGAMLEYIEQGTLPGVRSIETGEKVS
jgi:phosphoglycerate kinase